MNNNPISNKLNRIPRIVRLICSISDSWIVGSAADPNNSNPKDYDVAVPLTQWHKAAIVIPKDAKPTMFGDGWKFISDKQEVNVWPADVINIFQCAKCDWMWQPIKNIRINKRKENI